MKELSEMELFRQCYGGIPDGICIFRADGSEEIVFINKAVLKLYDCGSEQEFISLTGGRVENLSLNDEIKLPDDLSVNEMPFRFTYVTAKKHMRSADGVFMNMRIRGCRYILLHIANPQASLRDQNIDELTGLPSASNFYKQALNLARERSGSARFMMYCPVFLNIANFRGFNRTYGIEVGDRCLRFTASQLKRVFPDSPLTRLEADSFLGLLPRENLEEKIEEVCTAVNQYLEHQSCAMKAGIVKFDEEVPAEVIRHSFDMARVACDSVKNDGEHSYAVFQKEMRERVEIRSYILDHFEKALEKGYIKAYYQPVIRTFSGKVCSAEALCRWEDPVKGVIFPDIFIPVLEDARRIGRLDQYMIRQTVMTLHELLTSGRRVVPVSLNLSQMDFDLIQPLKCLNDACEKYHVPHKYIHVEITERVLAENQDRMRKFIQDFHEAGYEIWLDDFGSAYSSLKSLNQCPFDLIKLDMDFFRKFDARSRAIITSIVLTAKRLGLHTLAEGVETKEHLDFLKEIGCERIQGFYYSAAVPRLGIEDILVKKHLQLESSLEASVFGKAGLEDIVDHDPVSLFLYENGAIRLLTCNSAFRDEMRSVRGSVRETEDGSLLISSQAANRRIMQYLEQVFSKDRKPYVFLYNGRYMRLQASYVSGVRDFWIGRAGLINLSIENQMFSKTRHEILLRQSERLFDGIYYLNQKKDEIQVIQCVHPKVEVDEIFPGISASFVSFCHELVHLEDQERFLEFIDTERLVKSLASSQSGYVKGIFRIRREDGSYRWTVFSAVDANDKDERNLLLFEHAAYFEDEKAKDLLPVYVTSLQPALQVSAVQESVHSNVKEEAIAKSFYRFSGIPVFVKDREGRYLDVNPEMLSYLGMENRSDVLGKTADELGTFADPGEVTDEAEQVLDRGEIVHFSPTAVSGGVGRRIPVTEFPWYSGNQIGGAAGWIHIGEAREEQAFTQDSYTGMMNDYGSFLAGSTFDEAFRKENEDYFLILISARNFHQLTKVFGQEFSHRVVDTIAELIRQEKLPAEIVQAHLKGCRFLLLGREKMAETMRKAADSILKKGRQIREMYGIEGKLELEAAMGEGSEAAGFLELLQLLQRRMDQKEEKLAGQAAYLTHQSIQFSPAVMDDAPEHICLVDPENDDVVYMNNTMKRALNLPQDFKCYGHRCYELLLNRTSPCPDCTVRMLPLDTVISRHQRFGVDDKDFVTREMLVHWKDRLLRMSIGFASDENGSQLRNLLSDETWAGEAITSGLAEKNPDLGMQKTVNKVGWNLQAERLLVFEESDDGTVSCSYEWFRPDYPAHREELQSILIGKLAPLYRIFQTDKVVTIPDYRAFQQEHPEFWLPGVNIRNVISGHLESSGKSLGFTLVLNVLDQNFHEDSHILSTLTDFLAIMMQYRNSIQDALEHSMRDPLTGVLNRSGLARYLKTRKLQETAAVFSADINGLKTVNDLHGHLAGDRLIRTITDILVNVSDKDHVVRMGGDEFLMIREGMDETAADDLILQIRDICRVKGVSMALGYTIHTGAIDDVDEILRAADKAMYEDKGRYYHRRSTDR